MRGVISKETTIHTSEMLMHVYGAALGVVHQRREKTKNEKFFFGRVMNRHEKRRETQKTQARIEWKCDQLLRQRRLYYSFMYVQGGRQTMINAIPSGSLSFSFKFIYSPPFFFVGVSPFHINWHPYNTQLPGAHFLVRATFVLLFAYSFEECWGREKNNKNVSKAYFKKIPHHGHISSLPFFSPL